MANTYRVLIIGPSVPPLGGTRISFDYLYESIKSSQFDVELISLTYNSNVVKKYIKEISLIFQIFFRMRRNDLIFLNSDTRRFLTLGLSIYIWNKLLKKKIVYRAFGADLDVLYGRNIFNAHLLNMILRKADLVFLETKGLITFYNTNIAKNSKHLPNSRPLKEVTKIKDENKVNFYYAGHLKKSKGIDIILEACRSLQKENKNGWSMTFIGRTIDVEKPVDIPNVFFIEEVSNAELIELSAGQDVILFPSFHKSEGYPGSIIEALMCSNAVIVSNWRYLPELVDDNGYVMSANSDSEELKNLMLRYLTNPEILQSHQLKSHYLSKTYSSKHWNQIVIKELDHLCVG